MKASINRCEKLIYLGAFIAVGKPVWEIPMWDNRWYQHTWSALTEVYALWVLFGWRCVYALTISFSCWFYIPVLKQILPLIFLETSTLLVSPSNFSGLQRLCCWNCSSVLWLELTFEVSSQHHVEWQSTVDRVPDIHVTRTSHVRCQVWR